MVESCMMGEQLWNLIRTLNREKNVTIILVSHDMEDVYEMSERVLLMDHGRIVYDGGTVVESYTNAQ